MLVAIASKQRRAVSVVKAALLGRGAGNRRVSVTVQNSAHDVNEIRGHSVGVFVAAFGDAAAYYETGCSMAEAVRNTVNAIKRRGDNADSIVINPALF